MRFLRTFLLAFLSLLLAFPAWPQQTATTVQRDPEALTLLAQCTAAMGATGAAPAIYAQGTITPVNPLSPTSTVVLKSIGTDRVRSEVSLGGNQQIFVVNSGRGYSLVSAQRKTLALQTTAYYRPEHLSAFGCVIDVDRPSMNIAYVGLEQLTPPPCTI